MYGLKPVPFIFLVRFGTAEAMPFQSQKACLLGFY